LSNPFFFFDIPIAPASVLIAADFTKPLGIVVPLATSDAEFAAKEAPQAPTNAV